MKFEDVKVGLHVKDHLGNEYKVLYVDNKHTGFPLRLQCTKFVQPAQVEAGVVFEAVGDIWWVAGSRERMLKANDPVVQQILHNLCGTSNVWSYRKLKVGTQDLEGHFTVYPEARYNSFELTLDELELVQAVASTDALKLGMKLQRADGMYIVIGFDDQHVYLGAVVDATTSDGVTHTAAMCTQIPVEAPEGTLSLKDFEVVE
jgi:hypothetical protein|nr:MAG TPA: hypothetical protein [Caudoviricetes sp.]